MKTHHHPEAAVLASVLFLALISFSLGSTTPVSAQTVVDILPTANGAWGLEYHDGFLWVGNDTNGFIEKTDPSDGSVLETLPTPYDENTIQFGANHGVAWDGVGFWVAGDFNKDWLYRVGSNGALLDSLPTPTDAVGGLAFDGSLLLVTSYYPNGEAGILKVDPADGSIVGPTIPTQGAQPFGIVYYTADGTLWNGMDDNDGDVEKIWNLSAADGSVISSFDPPASSPKGIAQGGGFLWVIANNSQGSGRRIYKIDLDGGGTPDVTALPASHDFGIVAIGSPGSYNQTLRNDGDGDLTITGITVNLPFSYDPLSFPIVIAPAGSISFDVTFDPQVSGNHAASLLVSSDDVDEPSLNIPLSGVGVPLQATLNLSPPALNYADTGRGLIRGKALRIENVGLEGLVVGAISSDDPTFELRRLPELPLTLATFEVLEIPVVFAPTNSEVYGGNILIEWGELTASPETGNGAPATGDIAVVPLAGSGIHLQFEPGEPIWSAQGIENVVTVLAGPDFDSDGVRDAVMESYDAGADGNPFQSFYANSQGLGVGIWENGEGTSGGWGDHGLALASDIDGDGLGDIVRGTAWGGKRVEVRSSTDGSLIWSYDTRVDDNGGWVYAVDTMPDVSGDGIREVLAGAGTDGEPFSGARRLYCFDGATGATRFAKTSPDAFLCVGWVDDVNGDGVADVIGGAGGNNADDAVYCLSGAGSGGGTTLWSFPTGGSVWSVDRIDDVSGDGINDVIAGSWSNFVYCLNGVTGELIWQGNTGSDVMRVEAIGDVTGDGQEDVVVAQLSTMFRVLDGATGTIHWLFGTGANVWSVAGTADLNNDGVDDVLAGAQNDNVYCVSGSDGELIWSTNVGSLVFSVRAIADVNGNGTPDVLAGTQDLGGPGEGKFWCLDGGGGDVTGAGELPMTLGAFQIRLRSVSPNPTHDWTQFLFDAGSGIESILRLEVFDPSGRRIRQFEQSVLPGANRLVWDGTSTTGNRLASGVYYYRGALIGPRGKAAPIETAPFSGRVTLIR